MLPLRSSRVGLWEGTPNQQSNDHGAPSSLELARWVTAHTRRSERRCRPRNPGVSGATRCAIRAQKKEPYPTESFTKQVHIHRLWLGTSHQHHCCGATLEHDTDPTSPTGDTCCCDMDCITWAMKLPFTEFLDRALAPPAVASKHQSGSTC